MCSTSFGDLRLPPRGSHYRFNKTAGAPLMVRSAGVLTVVVGVRSHRPDGVGRGGTVDDIAGAVRRSGPSIRIQPGVIAMVFPLPVFRGSSDGS